MMGIKTLIVATSLLFHGIEPCGGLLHGSLAKIFGGYTNVRTMQLLNQLCRETQDIESVVKDACYGCFFKATSQPAGYPVLLSMAACADAYLNDTSYGHCQTYLRNATSAVNTRVSPNTIYCTFLECIRQVNKNALVKYAMQSLSGDFSSNSSSNGDIPPNDGRFALVSCIRECVGEALLILPSFTPTDVELAQLFVNTTACILAKTRCGTPNPITGVFQEDELSNKLHVPTVHAILVNTDYELNIVQLPFGSTAIDECAKYRNVEQAVWPGVDTC